MQRIYTNHFALYREGGTPDAVAETGWRACIEWVRADAAAKTGQAVPTGDSFDLPNGMALKAIRRSGKGAFLGILEYNWTEPDGLRFMSVKLGRLGDDVKVQVDVSAGSEETSIASWTGKPMQPGLIPALGKRLELRHKGRPLETEATDVKPHQAENFVNLRIRAPERQLPVLAIAEDPVSGDYLIQPDSLAANLVGVAEVYCFPVDTTFAISRLLTPKWSCFDGAARLYWPGWSPTDNLYKHPLFLKLAILEAERKGQNPADDIVRRIHELACASSGEDPLFRRLRDELTRQAQEQFKTLADGEARYRAMETDRDAWKAHAADLQSQLDGLRKAWVGYQAAEAETRTEAVTQVLASCRTAEDVLHLAAKRLRRLEIWTTAWRESHDYKSRHLDELYLALETLDELATDMAAKVGGLGMPLGQYFQKKEAEKKMRLPKFSANEAQTTLEKYRADRTFSNGGRMEVMEKHFTIGPGDSEGCIHLYWEFAEPGRIDIGYVGKHLRYVKEHG